MTTMNEERAGFEDWLGITPSGAAHDLAHEAFKAGAAWQRTQSAGVPEGWRAAAIPAEKPLPELMMASYHEAIGWNACRKAMLAASAQPAAQGQGEVQRLREAVPLYEAVERACGELPDGWTIQLHMENGAGWVELYDDTGCQVDDFPTNNERLDYTLNDAIDAALAASTGQEV